MAFFKLMRPYSQLTNNRSANLIRKEFLDYFSKDLRHSIVRSSPVSPITDPSLAFINAGMNQFKGIFLDYYESPVTKAVNSQKCIRVGGKHNDLNIVGNDSYHHTFFEMLGNWSFGDYFKKDACSYAWNLLTNVYGISKEYLYVTYFGGNEELGMKPDLECKDIWLRLGLPENKVLPFGIKDNFWEMGVSGPCGPCTEIHVDYMKRPTNEAARVNKGYADLMELWNIVFIKYERLANGCIVPLRKHHVDTGMGLERLVTLLQEKKSNYDTDLFQPLFSAIQKYSNAPEYKGTFGDDDKEKIDYGYRILADHTRMVTVALADNMLPEQHQKVRRALRNAIDIGERIFKKPGIVAELACSVADNLGAAYPELHNNLIQVQTIINFEEDLFKRVRNSSGKMWNKMVEVRPELASITDWTASGLVDGYKDLQSVLAELRKTNVLPGTVAFKLYDTYGLNSETIAELAQIESLYFDKADFEKEFNYHRYQSRIGLDKHSIVLTQESLGILEKNRVPKTDDSLKYNYIYDGSNYKFPTLSSKLIGIIMNGELVACKNYSNVIQISDADNRIATNMDKILNSTSGIGIILDKTVCYSLEGGQVSDKGSIRIKNLLFNIDNVRKVKGYVIHSGHFAKTDLPSTELRLQMEDDCTVNIEPNIRVGAMKHHTAAHLLNAALKQVMQVVYQRGSAVNTDSLKLQLNSFGEQFTSKQMKIIEDSINKIIQSNTSITVQRLNSLELLKEDDILLLPGEIYPYTGIRIIEINSADLRAKEACCGTHVHNTGVLQHFCFLSYTSKGATKRTVKAVVGPRALHMKQTGERICQKITELESTLQSNEFTYELFNAEINRIKQEINDPNIQIPYLMKETCLMHLENLSKAAWLQEKEIEKAAVSREIIDAMDSSACCIVHYLHKNPTYLSLHEIISLFPEVPVLVLSCANGFVKARCSVPQEITSNTFNAQTWMDIILPIFYAKHGPIKGFKPMLVASMKSTEVSQDFQTQLEKAVREANRFASMHVKQIRPINNKNKDERLL